MIELCDLIELFNTVLGSEPDWPGLLRSVSARLLHDMSQPWPELNFTSTVLAESWQ